MTGRQTSTSESTDPMTPALKATALLMAIALLAAVLAATGADRAAASHGHPFGAGFGVADAHNGPADTGIDVTAPAFPFPSGSTSASAWWAGTCDLEAASTTNGGVGSHNGGTDPVAPFAHCIDHGTPYIFVYPPVDPFAPPRETVWIPGGEPSWRLDPLSQAGAHPDGSASAWMSKYPDSLLEEAGGTVDTSGDGDTKTVLIKLPPGFVGDPTAVPKCPSSELLTIPVTCPPETQVGVMTLKIADGGTQSVFPIWNAEARDGKAAELIISPGGTVSRANVPVVADPRTHGADADFGVDALAANIPGGIPLLGQTVTLWGVPWAASHDPYRAPVGYDGHTVPGSPPTSFAALPENGLPDPQGVQPESYRAGWGEIKPFLTNPTECAPGRPITELQVDSWQNPGVFKTYQAPADSVVTGCDKVPFDADFELTPTSTAADSATGLDVDLQFPQNPGPAVDPPDEGASPTEVADYVQAATDYWRSDDGIATAHLDKAVVTLPLGMSVNPSGATGLAGCSDAQIGLIVDGVQPKFNDVDPTDGDASDGGECPAGSKIGTVAAETPLLEETLTGDVVLGMPRSTDPTSGDMFRLFLVLRNEKRGLLVKLFGSAVADRATGLLTTTFDDNPRLPVDRIRLSIKGGERGMLATQERCDTRAWVAQFTPWTAAHGGPGNPSDEGSAMSTSSNCAFGFSPGLVAGMDNQDGGATGAFGLQLTRDDGEQRMSGVTVNLPRGLLGDVGDVPLCSEAQAQQNACPAASRLGTVDAAAGSGNPFVLERKGSAYLTTGYKGAPYGLLVSVPVEAGPFRGEFALDPVVVRQALHVDRTTAQVTAVSDPFPQIWHGIPLRVREITVKIDRSGFMRNPTSCASKQVAASVASAAGATADVAVPFRAAGCRALPFKPSLRIQLSGRKQVRTGSHPGVRAAVTQAPGEAAIKRTQVRLPKSLALDPDNAQALCEFVDGTKPDLEDHCPKGSIVGRARAVSPLLARPLTGNVFFVKNVRIDKRTGNAIRTLPMIVIALRGEIAINLRGVSSVTEGDKLVSTFDDVPDAPISRFNLNIKGGRSGILVVTRTRRAKINLCSKRQVAESDMDGQNGRRHDRDIRIKTPCPRKRGR